MALHQAGLNAGKWRIAALMTACGDPYEREDYGGDPGDLKKVAGHLKATDALRAAFYTTAHPKPPPQNPPPTLGAADGGRGVPPLERTRRKGRSCALAFDGG